MDFIEISEFFKILNLQLLSNSYIYFHWKELCQNVKSLKIFLCKTLSIVWMKNLCLWKASLITEKTLLIKIFRHQGKILTYRKLPWSQKNLCLRKTWLIIEKSLLVETFLNHGNIFVCGKHPWSWKNPCFWRIKLGKISACGKLPWLWKNLCYWKSLLIKRFLLN